MSKSGDLTHLLNHPPLGAFNELNQAVDIFAVVGLSFELRQRLRGIQFRSQPTCLNPVTLETQRLLPQMP